MVARIRRNKCSKQSMFGLCNIQMSFQFVLLSVSNILLFLYKTWSTNLYHIKLCLKVLERNSPHLAVLGEATLSFEGLIVC